MNRKVFYDAVRGDLNLTTENVAGMEFLLDRMEPAKIETNDAADMLASTWWETGQRMQPIDEFGSAAYFDKRYGPGTKVGKVLGNTQPGDGARFHGRGYQQDTGRRNYKFASDKLGVDFVGNPDLMKVPQNAWLVMYHGMTEGWFTGKKLSDYIDDIDESDAEDLREFVEARRVINGTDKATTIGNLALTFEHALRKAGYGTGAAPEPAPQPSPLPPVAEPIPVKEPAQPPPTASTGLTPKQTGIGALIAGALVGAGAAWGWVWPVVVMALGIVAVGGYALYRRAHYKPNK